MSQMASHNGVPEVSAISNIEAHNGLEKVGEMSESANNKPTSMDKESKHSQVQADAVPMNDEQSDDTIEKLVDLFRDFLEAAPNLSTGPVTSNPDHLHTRRNMPGRKRFFGLTKGLSPGQANNRYDYEEKYPRDRFGEEISENARIWLTYLDEAEAFDRERVEGWKETVDVLLVFAGLFSGVITTFISQASQSLQQDSTRVTASLVFETVQLLRAKFTGLPITNVPASTITPTSPFTPSKNASLVNGLWFTSLAITLSTALFAVLAKQWLYYYMASISGTANQKVRARQLRFNGFEQWKVAAIVDLLPILLHISVGLFLTGIMILLFPLDAHIAWTVVVITGITFTLYFISVILPIWYPECPYTTSLTIYGGIVFFILRDIVRWTSTNLNKGFRGVWEKANLQVRRTIQHLVHYTLGLFQHLFTFISRLGDKVRQSLEKHRPRIFAADFPKFTKWREDNIKRAVSNATFLDSQAVDWLYTASSDRSVHRIIARSVAVHPTIAGQFEGSGKRLSNSLDVSETNLLDLRHGLCLDLLTEDVKHWRLLWSIPKSVLEPGEYQNYRRISERIRFYGSIYNIRGEIFDRFFLGNEPLELPLVMWCWYLKQAPRNDTVAAHILKSPQHRNLFRWKFDATRELIHNAGIVRFDSEELGWWRFEYLFDYFELGKPDCSSEAKSYVTCYRLLITVYHQLTSHHPFITNEEERQRSLLSLFSSFLFDRCPHTYEHGVHFTFFKDILCTDSFWCDSMTDNARGMAARCVRFMCIRPKAATLFPSTGYHELSLIYQWCSQNLDWDLSCTTSGIFTVLLLPRNRHHLSTILLNDPNVASNLSTCFGTLSCAFRIDEDTSVVHSLLMDLLESVEMPLFTAFYNLSVLVKIWELLSVFQEDLKPFSLLLKSKLDRKNLDELFAFLIKQALSETAEFYHGKMWKAPASLRMFEQIIGRTEDLSIPESGAMLERNYDNEERAQTAVPSERQVSHSLVHWTKKAFRSVWSKPLAE